MEKTKTQINTLQGFIGNTVPTSKDVFKPSTGSVRQDLNNTIAAGNAAFGIKAK